MIQKTEKSSKLPTSSSPPPQPISFLVESVDGKEKLLFIRLSRDQAMNHVIGILRQLHENSPNGTGRFEDRIDLKIDLKNDPVKVLNVEFSIAVQPDLNKPPWKQ